MCGQAKPKAKANIVLVCQFNRAMGDIFLLKVVQLKWFTVPNSNNKAEIKHLAYEHVTSAILRKTKQLQTITNNNRFRFSSKNSRHKINQQTHNKWGKQRTTKMTSKKKQITTQTKIEKSHKSTKQQTESNVNKSQSYFN